MKTILQKIMQLQNVSKWLLISTAVFTMVMMPVAEGQAAQSNAAMISKLQVQNAITQLGLNKSMTVGEFYAKNRDLYPERIRTQIDKFMTDNKDYVMPMFEVSVAKNSEGVEVPTLRISKDGELVNIQINGTPEKYVKFNNTNLTEIDIINFKDMFIKLNNGDANLRKQVEKANEKANSRPAQFNGYPSVSRETWVRMTPDQRAMYMLNMRRLWSDARSVLFEAQKNVKTKKTSAFNFLENIYKFFINDSEAKKTVAMKDNLDAHIKNTSPQISARAKTGEVNKPAANPSVSTASKSKSNGSFGVGKPCLIAGYVTVYSTTACTHDKIIGSYRGSDLYLKAKAECGNTKIACNPMVFGTPNGKPICIQPGASQDFQKATHYEGPCERDNHLGSKIDFLIDSNKHQGRYDADNMQLSSDQIKEQLKADQSENLDQTKSFIDGILKSGNSELSALFMSGQMSVELRNKLVEIQTDFNEEIKQAKAACVAASNDNANHEKNFWEACDQLHRRQIFIADYLSKYPSCKDGATINPETLNCSCMDAKKSEVIPGDKCPVGGAPVTPVDPAKPSQPDPVVSNPEKCTPACAAPQQCLLKVKSSEGAEAWECSGGPAAVKPKEEKSWFSGLFMKALPWVLGAGAIYLMYKLWSPKKPELKYPKDACPNGAAPPCTQACAAPLANVNGSCVCAACVPGQTLTNAATCTCSTTTATTTDVTCPDGVTHAATLALCPATQYTCWDGSTVTNPISCPEKPATKLSPATKTGK